MRYVENAEQKGCFLCRKFAERKDEQNCVLWRGNRVFVIMNTFPYNTGHLLVAPRRHVGTLEQLTKGELLELMEAAQRASGALKRAFRPHGFNLGMNLGRIAGAGLVGHLHLHLVPRWRGDTNFMPIVGETKVVSEELSRTCSRIRQAWTGLSDGAHGHSGRKRSPGRAAASGGQKSHRTRQGR
jgi:ATP adenylyltransferase